MKCQVIIAAGGAGERLRGTRPKSFLPVAGKPMIAYCCAACEQCLSVDSVIAVVPPGYVDEFNVIKDRYRLTKVVQVVTGGTTRRASVANGLAALDNDTDIVAIHDAARPCITHTLIEKAVCAAGNAGAVVVAVPVTSTVKAVDKIAMKVTETLQRDRLWAVQTPQVFKKDVIVQAHRRVASGDPSDDALLVEQAGMVVTVVMGDYENIKVTHPHDVAVAEAFLKTRAMSGKI